MNAILSNLTWNPDAVMPPGGTAIQRYYASKGANRQLKPGFWIAFWCLAIGVLALIDLCAQSIEVAMG